MLDLALTNLWRRRVVPNRKVLADLDQLSLSVGETIAALIKQANQMGRPFNMALSGGSTPRRLYECLARPPLLNDIPWAGVHIYFGDERAVSPADAQSNYLMAKTAMFDHLPIPSGNIHRIEGELTDHKLAAKQYQQVLVDSLPRSEEGIPIFDLVLLGIGADGHIASLFPGTPALEETNNFVCAVYVPKLHCWRLTITYPVINNAKHIFILAAGSDKTNIVHDVLSGSTDTQIFPVQRIQPKGALTWWLDQAAAEKLVK